MQTIHWRAKRAPQRAAMLIGLALVGLAVSGLAIGATGSPSMHVYPSSTGLKYSQNVEVKAQNLPKGSGTIALTICGLDNAAGQAITPTADDCAGANDLNSGLVKLQTWKDGTFDQKYVLPTSGQKFGKNQRFCNATHYCALVVADANPSKPAYEVETKIQFTDQKPLTKPTTTTRPKTTTTQPKPKSTTTTAATTTTSTTTTTTTPPGFLSITEHGTASAGPNGGSGGGGVSVTVTPPSSAGLPSAGIPTLPITTPTPTVPAPVGDAVTQACAQVAQAVQQGGGDASALTIACSTLVNGGGGAQLAALLQSPSLGCVELSSATQNNEQLAAACSQLATALAPYSSQLGDALNPVLGLLP